MQRAPKYKRHSLPLLCHASLLPCETRDVPSYTLLTGEASQGQCARLLYNAL